MRHKLSKSLPRGWEKALREWEEYLRAAGKSEATIKARVRTMRTISLGIDRGPHSVTARAFIRYSGSNEWQRDTRKNYTVTFRQFYAFFNKEAGRVIVDLESVPVPPDGGPKPRPASLKDIKNALENAPERVRLIIRLAAELGLRRGEIARLHSRDIVDGQWLRVVGKGDKVRMLPLNDDLLHMLRAQGSGFIFPGQINGHLSPLWVSKLASDYLPPGVRLHDLRHSFATRAYSAGADLLAVQRLLGHKSPDTMLRYILVSDENLRQAAQLAAIY